MVYLVCLVCLVEQDKPNERNRPDELVPLGYSDYKVFLIPIPDRSYCTALMCSPPGVGGAVGDGVGGGGVTGGGTVAVPTVNVTGTVTDEAPVAVIVTVAL